MSSSKVNWWVWAAPDFYSRGDRPEEIERVLRYLREEMRRRADVIDGLPREEAPEGKADSRAASRRDRRLEPIAIRRSESSCCWPRSR